MKLAEAHICGIYAFLFKNLKVCSITNHIYLKNISTLTFETEIVHYDISFSRKTFHNFKNLTAYFFFHNLKFIIIRPFFLYIRRELLFRTIKWIFLFHFLRK